MPFTIDFKDENFLVGLGSYIKNTKFEQAAADRVVLEQIWLRDLRQYRGIYDPEILSQIPSDRSKVYPRDTYKKVTGFIAKMMEMLFPATDKNFSIDPTEFPSIAEKDLRNIIEGLRQQKRQAAQMEAKQSGQQPDQSTLEPTSQEIEKAVQAFAKARANNMDRECNMQLGMIRYPAIAKRALRSGGIYGAGITEGPLVELKDVREWVPDGAGMYKPVVKKVPYPIYEPNTIWDCYPDLTAKKWEDIEFMIQRKVYTRSGLRALAEREDFNKDKILEYMASNKDGNYKARTYEVELQVIKNITNLSKRDARRYEAIRYFGFLSAHELLEAGLQIPQEEMANNWLVDVWTLDGVCIKQGLAAFGDKPSDMFHAYIHMDDEDSGLTGVGIPENLRDSQMSRCSVRRMIMDNSASVAGPIFGLDESKLARGKEENSIHAFSTLYFDGDANPNFRIDDVMKQFHTDAHIEELLALEARLKEDIDEESNLPSWTLGNAQGMGEAFRTSQNMSQLTGGANVILKDNVRAFDLYTTSLVGSLVKFNMDPELNDREDIKGDFNVMARGTISLVTKEVRGQALDQLALTLTPDDRRYIKGRNLLKVRFEARDLDPEKDDLLRSEEECDQIDKSNSQMMQQKSQMEDNLTSAKAQSLQSKAKKDEVSADTMAQQNQAVIEKLLAEIQDKLASASAKTSTVQLEGLKTLLEDMKSGEVPKEGANGD